MHFSPTIGRSIIACLAPFLVDYLSCFGLLAQGAESAREIRFSQDILPILSDKCFQCHGPDAQARKGDLRLDQESAAKGQASSGLAIIDPGKSNTSELLVRIHSQDVDEVMPPPELGRPLSQEEKERLETWIQEGAAWGRHWSLEPIEASVPPNQDLHPVDAFVELKLAEKGLKPQPEASRSTLIRRLALDLTGLPPTPSEMDAMLKDDASSWWEKAIDRFLASPAYGERMAWEWLDAARYADSNGYQGDRERTMWPWRDWVVRAFNRNMPWDQFTQWQLAGDLLPQSSEESILATGFCRNHMINGEGGRIAEENRVDYVMDMTETMGTVWLGATLNCARCHDHKFDPITQKEYYQFFDFFNQTPVSGGGGDPQTPPVLAIASESQTMAIQRGEAARDHAQAQVDQAWKTFGALAPIWERRQSEILPGELESLAQDREEERKELEALQEALQQPAQERDDAAKKRIRERAGQTYLPLQEAQKELTAATEALNRLKAGIPKVMVMQERKERRNSYRLERGLYNQPRETLIAGVPASLPALEPQEDQPLNRLDLARWLTHRNHPLTARVTVNRLWQQLFGIGLVKTSEDFGIQGEIPEHMALLDWLSAQFMDSGWNLKELLKTILTSEAYRRSSDTTPQLQESDPENRFMARGARYRLPSWMIRDQALSVAGLLDPRQGGPPVNGYQPEGVWEEATFGNKKYTMDDPSKRYRRSLYTFWRRIIAPTMFFDTASRQTCTVSIKRTNSPLHALATLNDVTYIEASRALASRAMEQAEEAPDQKLEWIYRRVLGRSPTVDEQAIWKESYQRAFHHFSDQPDARDAWLKQGSHGVRDSVDREALSAWATVCLGILNLDETLNRE